MKQSIIPEIIRKRDLNKRFNVENKTLNFNFDIKNKNISNKNKTFNKTINNRNESLTFSILKFIKSILTLPFNFIINTNNKYKVTKFIDNKIRTHNDNKKISKKINVLKKCFKKDDEIL